MPFNPSGLPTLPTCESDIARWAAEIESYLVAKFTTAHNAIDNVAITPFDLCEELGSLSPPSCLIPVEGIDNTGFSYAEEGDTLVAGSGVLPWPGSAITGVVADFRKGTLALPNIDNASWSNFTVTLSPAVASANYHVSCTLILNNSNERKACSVLVHTKTTNSFVVAALGNTTAGYDAKIDWLLLLMAE